MAIALVAMAAATIAAIGCSRGEGRTSTTTTLSPTTLWPYGQPEYSIEVPEGYEQLLPERAQETKPIGRPAPAEPTPGAKPAQPKSAAEKDDLTYIASVKDRMAAAGAKPALIIVIDDAGYSLTQLKPFLALPFPITIAVLPQVEHSAEAASLAADAGKEVVLHQPMQALGGNNPGPGAIRLGMPREEVASTLAKNLDGLPQAIGVNNHMGSAATRDQPIMAAVLELVKKRGIYYLDSLTAPGTATAALCRELSIPYWERDVFLDNSGDRQSIIGALEEGKKVASARGASVLIGHVWSAELAQTLADVYPSLIAEGYSLSTISKYMMQSAAGDANARPGD
ncbi:divergent polysaccharide deacetylase family protein [bacterium]|nr:divergent polysaccharide deacetylase family protein [bacterium]